MPENSDLKVIAFNCSLKSANEAKETSSTEKLVNQLLRNSRNTAQRVRLFEPSIMTSSLV